MAAATVAGTAGVLMVEAAHGSLVELEITSAVAALRLERLLVGVLGVGAVLGVLEVMVTALMDLPVKEERGRL